jgi:hypothetical protein
VATAGFFGGTNVVGATELRRAVHDISDGLDHDMTPVNRAMANIWLPAARSAAPMATGALASSLTVGVAADRATIGSDLPYAGPIHWGWPARAIDPNTFLVDSARATEDRWTDAYSNGVQDLIDRSVIVSGADNPH